MAIAPKKNGKTRIGFSVKEDTGLRCGGRGKSEISSAL